MRNLHCIDDLGKVAPLASLFRRLPFPIITSFLLTVSRSISGGGSQVAVIAPGCQLHSKFQSALERVRVTVISVATLGLSRLSGAFPFHPRPEGVAVGYLGVLSVISLALLASPCHPHRAGVRGVASACQRTGAVPILSRSLVSFPSSLPLSFSPLL